MSKRITTGMRIEAARIGCEPHELGGGNLDDARKIDRAINAAVRKERERCVGIVQKECNTDIAWVGRTTVCKSIITAIRKGKA